MNGTGIAYHRTSFLALAALLALSGLGAAIDIPNRTAPGFTTDGNNIVTHVTYLGPAAAAGLDPGDRIISIDNIPVEDYEGLVHHARPPIDEVWIYVVDRAGQTFNVSIRQGALSASAMTLAYLTILSGFGFLWYGVRPYLKAPSPATTMLAFFGFAFGAWLLGSPWVPWPVVRSLTRAFFDIAQALGFATLIHFLLLFPKRHPFLAKPHAFKLVYGPALAMAALRVVIDLIQPDASPLVNHSVRTMEGLFVMGYADWALYLVVMTQRRATEEERQNDGLDTILSGAFFGLVPIALVALLRVVLPGIAIPYSEWAGMTLVLLPFAFKRSTLRSAFNAEV